MPSDVLKCYNEGRDVLTVSPRAAAALLRLGLQLLCVHLGEKGKNIDDDIASLVAKGMPKRLEQLWDIIRITANNAVHPGEIETDDPETVGNLFFLLNRIVEDQIALPEADAALYNSMPPGAIARIEERNAKAKAKEAGNSGVQGD